MILEFWQTFLYQPLFNVLIWIYANLTDQNLGWAIVYLTILLRLVLLPFTIKSERNKSKNTLVAKEIIQLDKDFAKDHVLKKEEIRKVLKKHKISPWSKAVVLGIQGLVLVLLYQVFLRGITGKKIVEILYPVIEFPGQINTDFYGTALGDPYNVYWSGLVMAVLMVEIYFDFRKRKSGLAKSDLTYFFLFPGFVFLFLYILPVVKALFILTSILVSIVIHNISKVFLKPEEL
jgi:membrane protein insertase Oxa1/YidC/SpoIIIJ